MLSLETNLAKVSEWLILGEVGFSCLSLTLILDSFRIITSHDCLNERVIFKLSRCSRSLVEVFLQALNRLIAIESLLHFVTISYLLV